ncbi:hypothetical protein PIB30_043722 [Stylosanthes scabra]|uniref:Uncharacterized protein n=1 Tax=Stylosanthes scabra TaxID=79078 RepID=A0ABU6VIH1_9FABA|nr:hypothetical protein [Stylosanthes scabra]
MRRVAPFGVRFDYKFMGNHKPFLHASFYTFHLLQPSSSVRLAQVVIVPSSNVRLAQLTRKLSLRILDPPKHFSVIALDALRDTGFHYVEVVGEVTSHRNLVSALIER